MQLANVERMSGAKYLLWLGSSTVSILIHAYSSYWIRALPAMDLAVTPLLSLSRLQLRKLFYKYSS